MRIIHGGDLHLGLTRYGHALPDGRNSRVADFSATLRRFAETAVAEGVDVAVIAGDLYNGRRPGNAERRAVSEAVAVLRAAGVELLIASGTHDGPGTIHDPQTATLGYLEALELPGVRVYTEPTAEVIDVEAPGGRLGVVAIPSPHKRALSVALRDQATEPTGQAVETLIAELYRSLGPKGRGKAKLPTLFIGHLSTKGALITAESAMKIGWDVSIDPESLADFSYAALGHIHRQQQVGPRAWYCGSAEYIDFGETGPKGWLLADLATGEVRAIDSGARPVVTVDIPDYEAAVDIGGMIPDGAIVRVRLAIGATEYAENGPRWAEGLRAKAYRAATAAGASFVRVDLQLPEAIDERQRLATEGLDLAALLRRHFTRLTPARGAGTGPDGERDWHAWVEAHVAAGVKLAAEVDGGAIAET